MWIDILPHILFTCKVINSSLLQVGTEKVITHLFQPATAANQLAQFDVPATKSMQNYCITSIKFTSNDFFQEIKVLSMQYR